ncbi:MAG: oligosaccharide flippase family protein [Deltaproteobacteria bacterium]|nr:oligosaccharide flippase family protein [Deltaproteobacteria bacterium]
MTEGSVDEVPGDKPAETVNADVMKRRAVLGVIAMIARTVVLQFVVFGGTIVLARLLEKSDFGVFTTLQFVLTFFLFFGDAGLGAALVQKKEEPSQRELASVLVFQVIISLVVMAIVCVAASWMHLFWKDLPEGSTWLMRAISLSLLLTSLRVVPSIMMERYLKFGRLAILEVLLSVGFYLGATIFAFLGFRVWALIIGVLIQGFVGVIAAFVMSPWRPSIAFDWKLLRPIIAFGIPFQLKNVIGFVNGATMPVYAGRVLGMAAVGVIGQAQNIAFFPLRLVEIMARVTFPLFARLHGDKELFAATLARSVQICALGTLFFVGLLLGLGRNIVHVWLTDKWIDAVPLLYIYAGAISIGFLSPLVASALDAAGKPKVFSRLAIGWTALNWMVVPLTTPKWGLLGFVGGYTVHVVAGNLAVIIVLVKLIPNAKIWPRVRASVVGGCAVWAAGRYLVSPWANSWAGIIGGIAALVLLFAGIVALLDRSAIKDALSIIPKKKQ